MEKPKGGDEEEQRKGEKRKKDGMYVVGQTSLNLPHLTFLTKEKM